jgi:hypothetical protein
MFLERFKEILDAPNSGVATAGHLGQMPQLKIINFPL